VSKLIVTGMIRGSTTTMCSFSVSVNGAPFAGPETVVLDQSFFTIPDQPATVTVRATPLDTTKYGALDGPFQVDAAGNLVSAGAIAEFSTPLTVTPFPVRTILLFVHFTPLLDVTERARLSLSPSGPGFPGYPAAPQPGNMTFRAPFVTPMPPPTLAPRTVTNLTVIASPSISGSALQVTSQMSSPQGSITIFEWRGATAPRLYAVFWPSGVASGVGASRTPFLIYYHATAGQNAPPFFVDARDRHDPATGSTYPWGFDYQFFGFWRYLNYDGDPFKNDPFCKGLPHQIADSGKNVVLVLPLNKVAASTCDETASLTEATFVQELLEELQAYVFRRGGNYLPPGLGRLGMASFSSGHALLSCFLGNPVNHAHPIYLDVLQEVYLFDPHADQAAITLQPVVNMTLWANRGQSATKVARLYTQNDPAQSAQIFTQIGIVPTTVPFDVHASGSPNRSVACLPLAAWNALATRVGSTFAYVNTQASHQVISALMLTDALRRSNF
jgi:hypothetical protein